MKLIETFWRCKLSASTGSSSPGFCTRWDKVLCHIFREVGFSDEKVPVISDKIQILQWLICRKKLMSTLKTYNLGNPTYWPSNFGLPRLLAQYICFSMFLPVIMLSSAVTIVVYPALEMLCFEVNFPRGYVSFFLFFPFFFLSKQTKHKISLGKQKPGRNLLERVKAPCAGGTCLSMGNTV